MSTTQTSGRFDRTLLPTPEEYFALRGLKLTGPRSSKWKTTRCDFHDGSDSMRINTKSGGWICMACGVHGKDVLAYEMQAAGTDFVTAARDLRAWVYDGSEPPVNYQKPLPLPARQAIEVIAFEALFLLCCAGTLRNGNPLTDGDMDRLATCTGRIRVLSEEYAA